VFVVLLAGATIGGYHAGRRHDVRLAPPLMQEAMGCFRLVDQLDRPVTEADVKGRVLVVSFVFTACSATCLQVSHNMARIQEELAGANDVLLASISVDPRGDSPAALREFGAKFKADASRWMFLTGEPASVHGLLRKSFLKLDQSGNYNPMPGGYLDADRIAVVDGDGRVRGFVRATRSECVGQVVAAVNAIRAAGR
jgi:protein SCO1/2